MKQGVEKPYSDTQGQFRSTATQSKLPCSAKKQNKFQPEAITLKYEGVKHIFILLYEEVCLSKKKQYVI